MPAPLTTDRDLQRAAIRTTLLLHIGNSSDASAIAQAALQLWQQMAARLIPVIGAQGVDVLLNRSLYLTSASFPWLDMRGEHGADTSAKLESCLAQHESTVVIDASHALLVTVVELLATLIGEDLTERLLRPVWMPGSQRSEGDSP